MNRCVILIEKYMMGRFPLNYWSLYDEIISGLPDDVLIDDYAVGRPWTYVRAGNLVGICMTIPAYSRPRLRKESFLGCSLREAGEYVLSWQGQEASIAVAAINAYYNQPGKVQEMQGFHGGDASAATLEERKKLEAFAMYTERIRGKKVAVIGHFPNFQKKWESICELSILEMQPEWGDYPAEAAEFILPQQDFVFMTGATFTNKTMPRLLELSKDAVTVLVGASMPMHPCLFDYGANGLSGFTVTDAALAADLVHFGYETDIASCGKMADVLPLPY